MQLYYHHRRTYLALQNSCFFWILVADFILTQTASPAIKQQHRPCSSASFNVAWAGKKHIAMMSLALEQGRAALEVRMNTVEPPRYNSSLHFAARGSLSSCLASTFEGVLEP
jgi:hypothetical protein